MQAKLCAPASNAAIPDSFSLSTVQERELKRSRSVKKLETTGHI